MGGASFNNPFSWGGDWSGDSFNPFGENSALDTLSGGAGMRDAAGNMLGGIAPAGAAVTGGNLAANAALASGRGAIGQGRGRMDAARMRALSGMDALRGAVGGQAPGIRSARDDALKAASSQAAGRGQFDSSFAAKQSGTIIAKSQEAERAALLRDLMGVQGMQAGIEGQFAGMGQGYDRMLAGMYGQQAGYGMQGGIAQGQNIMAGHGAYAQGMYGASQALPGMLSQAAGTAGGIMAGKAMG